MKIRSLSKSITNVAFLCSIVLFFGCRQINGQNKYKNAKETPEVRAKDLMSKMTLEEKVAQLSGLGNSHGVFGDVKAGIFGTKGNERLGIPTLVMGHGITGVRSGRDVAVKSTYMLAPIGAAATWDTDLYARASVAIAKEMVALGQNLNLGTTLNIIRHPLGGRGWECFSEDPYLTARMGVEHVKAMQANGVISGPKHFVANNQELHRHDINNELEERALREIYLPAFKTAVVEGGALNIMAAYNRVNGTFMCENKWLLTDVLRDEWGFKGFVLSDFGKGVQSTVPTALSGMNIEMSSAKWYGAKLVAAVNNGEIKEAVVDGLVYDKLFTMFKMGLFDHKWKENKEVVHSQAHQDLALEVARKSGILLKNKNNVLPLALEKGKKLAVIGPNGKRYVGGVYSEFLQGGGSGGCYYFEDAVKNPVDEIAKLAKGMQVSYARGAHIELKKKQKKIEAKTLIPDAQDLADLKKNDKQLIDEAVVLAKKSDQVILIVGITGSQESEGRDRKSTRLPANQERLIKEVTKVNKNVVVVMVGGSYFDASPWIDKVDGVVNYFYCGEKIGQAMAEVLFGKVNPSGKLPISYPKSDSQYPKGSIFKGGKYSDKKISNVYAEGIFVGYRYFDKEKEEMRFPFGYGLSYTSFEYSKLKVKKGKVVEVSFTLKNTGKMDGDEVAQLYIHDKESSVPRPIRELKGFKRVSLKSGESKEVRFELNDDAFAFWSPTKKDWTVELGEFDIEVGANSRDIKLTETIKK
ncbi:glycoside hydrolase family 3 C-terminal domain-containing protein [Flavicella sediminum]|uniref:glycoside hydrolase family 3 C-terminal domain-containing protein n=1 Tax=Flavicella sediminum TaxID=2585141 RepID=UPI0011234675|nr:glycoside hydrolase family 3 C-terminal domain-containing protein [Flavicella sediminum]